MKIFKIILINILMLTLVLIVSDYLLYKSICKEYYKRVPKEETKSYPPPKYRYFYLHDYSHSTIQYLKKCKNPERTVVYDNITRPAKPPILIFGCSFAYGAGLEDQQTFSYKLQKQTNRIIYNFGICGGGLQHMLYILQNKQSLKSINIPPPPGRYLCLYSKSPNAFTWKSLGN